MKVLLTHIWKTLPIGVLISLGLISLAFSKSSQISPSSSNHLKTEHCWFLIKMADKHSVAIGGQLSNWFSSPGKTEQVLIDLLIDLLID